MHQVREGGPQRSGDYCKAWLQREGLEQTQQDAEGVEAWAAEATSYAKGASKGIYKLLKHTKATFSLVSGEITTDGHKVLLSSMRFRCELRPRLLTWAGDKHVAPYPSMVSHGINMWQAFQGPRSNVARVGRLG